MQRPSLTLVLSGIFIAYILHSLWTIASLFLHPTCQGASKDCLQSHLSTKPKLQLLLYVSNSPNIQRGTDMEHLGRWTSLDLSEAKEEQFAVSVPSRSQLRSGSLHLHAFLTPMPAAGRRWQDMISSPLASYARAQLIQSQLPETEAFNLLGGEDKVKKNPDKKAGAAGKPAPHLRSHVPLQVLAEEAGLPRHNMAPDVAALVSHRLSPDGRYLPLIRFDQLSTRSRHMVLIDAPPGAPMNVTVRLDPVSLGKIRLWMQFELGMTSMRQLGFTNKDLDEVKGIFTDTNLYLLLITMLVSAIHLLFDVLALKNDVQFWRRRSSFAGLSTKAVLWRAFSQIIIFLYLLDEETSYLVIVPMAAGTVIEIWKVFKAFHISVSWGLPPRVTFGARTSEELRTAAFDSQSMTYLAYLLYPLCAGGAVYSLLYTPHKSWYSWCIQSVVNGVYAFGFLFMLPQLFVNYKLKSVAHLPWRALMYKAFNTFIDDLFAFIITMPTAHRVACFRDDLVFLVYLYQRWLYPVDQTRLDAAASFAETSEVSQDGAPGQKKQQ
ncbi:LOW QUALITY PROTEIN: cleft lip and palate transmembrane protein 1-like protein [Pollicipes pollicipes]|uniref:LOW QUALITY PROTEIN: cleft lip and palate transmembrane protein 1-like protein n=1 Tax=Pollicipes pollicipes TaxID=41117 RepID=UPI001884CE83|nr:LOW QUALITY PROTEIN: cleft lip and palate transmembrane protein 1-like protein [Pollicipes pollicipes]